MLGSTARDSRTFRVPGVCTRCVLRASASPCLTWLLVVFFAPPGGSLRKLHVWGLAWQSGTQIVVWSIDDLVHVI